VENVPAFAVDDATFKQHDPEGNSEEETAQVQPAAAGSAAGHEQNDHLEAEINNRQHRNANVNRVRPHVPKDPCKSDLVHGRPNGGHGHKAKDCC
jgi:hypothetical protein